MFFYADGQEIHKGDRIKTGFGAPDFVSAIVEDVFQPGTENAKDCSCMETGGVFIKEVGDEEKKVFGAVVETLVDGKLNVDYELLSRCGGEN